MCFKLILEFKLLEGFTWQFGGWAGRADPRGPKALEATSGCTGDSQYHPFVWLLVGDISIIVIILIILILIILIILVILITTTMTPPAFTSIC